MKRSLFLLLAFVPILIGVPGGDPTSLSFGMTRASEPFVESVTGWMVQNTVAKLFGDSKIESASADEVRSYFTLATRLSQAVRDDGSTSPDAEALQAQLDDQQPRVEAAIQEAVAEAAARSGLGFEVAGFTLFPPVYFRFQSPPYLLVVSPRSQIQRATTVLLKPRLPVAEQQSIEASTSNGEYSTLVVDIGGLGVYPSMVPESSDPRWTFRTVAHEWTHQFLALRPLGWRYATGGEGDARMITVNETTAEIVGNEIGDMVFAKFYPAQAKAAPFGQTRRDDVFRGLMREIRMRVDQLLAEGEVQEAEGYMDASRGVLAAQGFYIRKLNQAYFAFYGSYAQDPAAGGRTGAEISERIQRLRQQTLTLGDFVWRISGAGSYGDFSHIAPAP